MPSSSFDPLPAEIIVRIMLCIERPAGLLHLASTCRRLHTFLENAAITVSLRAAAHGLVLGDSERTLPELVVDMERYATATGEANWVHYDSITIPAKIPGPFYGDGVVLTFERQDGRWQAVVVRTSSPLRAIVHSEVARWDLPLLLLFKGKPRLDLTGVLVAPQHNIAVFVWYEQSTSAFSGDCITYILPLRLTDGELISSPAMVMSCPGFKHIVPDTEVPFTTNGRFLAINAMRIKDNRHKLVVLDLHGVQPSQLIIEGDWCSVFAFVDDRRAALHTVSHRQSRITVLDIQLALNTECWLEEDSDLDPQAQVLRLDFPFVLVRRETTEVRRALTGERTRIGSDAGIRRIPHSEFEKNQRFSRDGYSCMLVILDVLSGGDESRACRLHFTISFNRLKDLIDASLASHLVGRDLSFPSWASRGVSVAQGAALPRGALADRSVMELGWEFYYWVDWHPAHRLPQAHDQEVDEESHPDVTWGHDLSAAVPSIVRTQLPEPDFAIVNEELRSAGLRLIARPTAVTWMPLLQHHQSPDVHVIPCDDAVLVIDYVSTRNPYPT
ncbi:hypothetical protein PENSPDRAFT_690289 [Peniophora sp. CONT]|nr:hypothetical protein PENSPDRAFT_690289 [Peniophora sp. CONT]